MASDLQGTIHCGACYSNGEFGHRWQVRRIIAVDDAAIRYQVISGEGRRKEFTCSPAEFNQWARHEVKQDETSWRVVNREIDHEGHEGNEGEDCNR